MKSPRLIFAFPLFVSLSLSASKMASGASLPTGLVGGDIETIIDRIGVVSSTRLLRAAEAYPSWPGIRLGVDVSVAPQVGFNALGDKNGAEPQIFALPRLHLTKGLWEGVEIIFSTMPFSNPGYSATGGILKWNFYNEKAGWLSVSTFAGYTYVNAFRDDFSGNNFEFGLYASKDYVRIKPYLGATVMLAQGYIRPALAKAGAATSSMKGVVHAFIGFELEYPVTIAAEFSLYNLSPTLSLFIGKRF